MTTSSSPAEHIGGDEPTPTATKARILRAAADLFARKGYDATGVAEIGEAVGLGRGALYHHIESKEALLYEISIRHVSYLVAFAEDLLEVNLPADLKVRRLSRELMRVISTNLPELTTFFHDFRALSEERAASLGGLRQRFEDAWLKLLEQGVEAGIFRELHPIVAKGILGMHNYSYLWLTPDGELEPEDIADVFCDALLHGLMVPSRRR